MDIFFWNACINTSAGGYQLWLKSLKRFSTSRLNELAAISPALGIFYTLFVCFASDLILRPAWAITVSHLWNIIRLTILVIWKVPESALWFAFLTAYSAVAMSSVLYGWINSQMRYSPVERSLTLILVNTVAQSTTCWTPLLVFKTVEGPRFTKGYSFVLGNAVCLIALSHIVQFFIRREERVVDQRPINLVRMLTLSGRTKARAASTSGSDSADDPTNLESGSQEISVVGKHDQKI